MGQRLSRKENAKEGGECVHWGNLCTPLTPTDHKAEHHPRPDETPGGIGEGGEQERREKEKKKKKKRNFRKLVASFFCFSCPKSTKAQGAQVEQGLVEEDTDEPPSRSCTEDQTSLQDVILTVEDNDHQEPPSSSPELSPATNDDQQVEDVLSQEQDSPGSLSVGEISPHLLRQLDRDEIKRIEYHIGWKYASGKKIGEGGFGSVFEGTRCKDGLQVAVKLTAKTKNTPYISLPNHHRPVPLEVALTLMANQGPRCRHIIELLDWKDHPDKYVMVLERPLPCMDMHRFWMNKGRLFSEELARHLMCQVIDAAAICCSRGVFHRDVKMQNLLVNTETLEVKLIDFGCGDRLISSSYKTYSGTKRYCPPEYFEKGEYYGKQATVWSLGVLLFTMITSLFPDSSDIELMDADVWFQPGFSDECCRFIRGCLKSEPEQRLHLEEMLSQDWFKVPL